MLRFDHSYFARLRHWHPSSIGLSHQGVWEAGERGVRECLEKHRRRKSGKEGCHSRRSGRKRERHIQKHTHIERETEREKRGEEETLRWAALGYVPCGSCTLFYLPVLPHSLSPAGRSAPAVFSSKDKQWRMCSRRGEICKGSVGLSCVLREYLS